MTASSRYPRTSAALLALLACTSARASDPPLQASILAFGDLYTIPQHHLDRADGESGLWLRRLYLTLDYAAEDSRWEFRARSETNGPDYIDSGWKNQVKDLYAAYSRGDHTVTIGKQPTLTFNALEKFWGYRALSRTPPDLQGIASRFEGISLKGKLLEDGQLRYGIVTQLGKEGDQQPLYQASLAWHSKRNWLLELYADETEREDEAFEMKTYQVFGAYKQPNWRIGGHYTRRNRDNYKDPSPDDIKTEVELLAGFYIHDFQPFDLILTIDRLLVPSTKADDIRYIPMSPDAKATIYQAGLDFTIRPWLKLIPNIWYVNYDEPEDPGVAQPDDDIYLKVTFDIRWP